MPFAPKNNQRNIDEFTGEFTACGERKTNPEVLV
jgi:hypothetical protein